MGDRLTYGNHIRVPMEQFGSAVRQILDDITTEVRLGMNEGIRETARETAKVTRDTGTYQNRRPKYRKSISYRFSTAGITAEAQIYARGHEYSLTHLLENGHHLWNKPGYITRAFKHWKPGEEWADAHIVEIISRHINL